MTQNKTKFYIKQFVINDYKDFQQWAEANLTSILKTDVVVGYLFSKRSTKAFEPSQLLNVYFIKRKYYRGPEVPIEQLADAWKSFLYKFYNKETDIECKTFKNPPIELWLDSKDYWCKKIAKQIAKQFDISYNEALSNIYMSVIKLYAKENIYMGSLNYVHRTIYNDILMLLRAQRRRINVDSGLAISLNTPLGIDSDGEELLLEDTLPAEEDNDETSLSYRETLDACKRLLSKDFSVREIEQIILLNGKESLLPINLYRRLYRWRTLHSAKEIYDD